MTSAKKLLEKILEIADEETRNKILSLNEEERRVFEYFLQYISVGSLIAIRELKAFYRIAEPKDIIRSLIQKGLVEQGSGCYSLAKNLRDMIIKILRMSRA